MSGKLNINLITYLHPKSPVAEAYRILRTNLNFSSLNYPCKAILLTSPNLGDGKSTTAANLAVVLAQAGHRVMLVDCDLRKPRQHKFFGVSNQKGMTNYIMQEMSFEEVSYPGIIPNLTLVTSGPIPPNPAEMMASERMQQVIEELKEVCDYLIVDSPPVIAVTDASILASRLDGVILVVKSAGTRIDMAQDAKEQLLKANARIIGVVLNKVKMSKKDYYYYYYSYKKE